MLKIDEELYELVAELLLDAIGEENYFSDILTFDYNNMHCTLKSAMIAYRKKIDYPEGSFVEIEELVPVWWEFHTTVDGEEMLNEFNIHEVCDLICS